MTENFDQDDGNQYGSYQDDDVQGDGLIRIQWRQGDVKQGTPGYFFLSGRDVPEDFTPGAAWAAHKEYFEQTDSREDGWKAEQLPVAIICARSQPYRRGENVTEKWLESWPKGGDSADIAMHCDVLLIADGLQDLGPVKWSTGATTTAFAVIGRPDPKKDPAGGILHRIREEVLGAADKAAKIAYRKQKKLYWLFWVTIGSQRDAKGAVVFTKTKAKAVTKPVPLLPATVDTAWLKANWAGDEMAKYGNEIRQAYEDWRATRRTNDAQPVKPMNGRNVPQPVDETEDIPF